MSSISSPIIRRLLCLTASVWGLASVAAFAADGEAGFTELRSVQMAGLSPEQRQELRNQVREHRERSREEYRDISRNPPPAYEPRQQRLSPDEREEFRQWMRERRGGGDWRNPRGRG